MSRATRLLELMATAPGKTLNLDDIMKDLDGGVDEGGARDAIDAARDLLRHYDIDWVESKTWKLVRRAV